MHSAMEAAVILSNLARHSAYIKATTSYLLSHVRTNQDMIGPHLLSADVERLDHKYYCIVYIPPNYTNLLYMCTAVKYNHDNCGFYSICHYYDQDFSSDNK